MTIKEEKPKAKSPTKHFKKLNKAQCRELIGINNFKMLATYGDFDIYECLERPGEFAIRKTPKDETVYTEYKMDFMVTKEWLLSLVKEYKEIWNEK